MDLNAILNLIVATFTNFGQMAGVAAFISALVNALKYFGVVTDGNAGQWFAGLDLGAIVALIAVQIAFPSVGVDVVNVNAGLLASVVILVLGYLVSMKVGLLTHNTLSALGIKIFGTSFTKK